MGQTQKVWMGLLTTFTMLGQMSVLATPLDDYIHAKDQHYAYTFLTSIRAPSVTLHILNMTSQKWMDERTTNRPIWWHYLTIIVPDQLNQTDTSFLLIDGNKNSDGVPNMDDPFIALMYAIAVSTNTVVTVLKQVPNQPIVFKADPSQKSRDHNAVIAWSWKIFLDNGSNPDILAFLPMTKAAVCAMDTVTSYCLKTLKRNMTKFFVSGFSKRGWATWLTAAVDKRVIGIAPGVMDLLNLQKSLQHHFRSLGGWSFAMEAFYNANVTRHVDAVNFKRMAAVIDPLVYSDRYSKIPKYVVTATGDEYFLPDDSHYYFNNLTGPKYLRLVPDAEHTMIGHVTNVLLGIRSFYLHVLNGISIPSLRWTRSQTTTGGEIVLWTDREPSSAFMYYAYTLKDGRKDFRLFRRDEKTGSTLLHPVIWFKGQVRRMSATQYEAELERPLTGWAAFFIQVTFDGIGDNVLEFTTELNVIPDTFPYKECHDSQCYGTLV